MLPWGFLLHVGDIFLHPEFIQKKKLNLVQVHDLLPDLVPDLVPDLIPGPNLIFYTIRYKICYQIWYLICYQI